MPRFRRARRRPRRRFRRGRGSDGPRSASGPTASTICCAAHAAYGCAVTLTCRTRRRSSERTKNTYSTLNVTVGTVRKSIAIVPAEMDPHERPPRLRRRPTGSAEALRHVLGDRVLADVVAELRELGRRSGDGSTRVLAGHPLDERDDLRRERRSSDAPRLPRPEAREAAAVPRDHGRRLHDRERVGPSRPDARDDDPEGAVDRAKRRPGPGALEHGELLPEHEVLDDEARARAEGGEKRTDDCRDERQHRRNDGGPRPPCHRRNGTADGVRWCAARSQCWPPTRAHRAKRVLRQDSCAN